MKKETIFLKIVLFVMAAPALVMCFYGLPMMAHSMMPDIPEVKVYLSALAAYAASIAYVFTLFQAFKLLTYIDKNTAFSEKSVLALRKIKRSAVVVSFMFACELPLFYFVADGADAPGVMVMGLIAICAPVVISVFAAVLEKLLQKAIELKDEQELTV
jgi:Protein of unknown function (DUF2975)